MKVILDNSKKARYQFPMRVTCKSCKSELEANAADIKYMQGDPREHDDTGYDYVTCPVCNAMNTVKPGPIRTSATAEQYYNK